MPDTKITWGPAIPTPNGRPSWLLDTETVVDIKTNYGWRCSDGGAGAPPYQWSWKVIKAIRLPADHAYYLATDKGFTYWPGGESAPEDYDGGEIIYRSGSVQPSARFLSWEHTPGRTRFDPEYDIIGYHPKAAPGDDYGPAIRSEEHTSELQSLMRNSYAVFCLK